MKKNKKFGGSWLLWFALAALLGGRSYVSFSYQSKRASAKLISQEKKNVSKWNLNVCQGQLCVNPFYNLLGLIFCQKDSAIKIKMLKTSPPDYSFSPRRKISVIFELAVLAKFAPSHWRQLQFAPSHWRQLLCLLYIFIENHWDSCKDSWIKYDCK